MSREGYMTKNDSLYFTDNYNEYQKNGLITFDLFSSICREYKGITEKPVLEETLKDLKNSLDKKNVMQTINLKQEEYFNFVNTVLKDQAQSKNINDPEMDVLFRSLAGKEGDYVYKRKLTEIINMFGLPINLNTFFQPVSGQEEINFNEFCCLFRAENVDENLRKTFITFIDKSSKEPEEKEDIKAIYKANFPIKYYGN